MGTCGNPMMGGKRSRKNRGRKMRGGAVEPSFGVDPGLGTAGPSWTGMSTAGAVNSATGQPMADPTAPQAGGRRRKGMSAKTMRRMLKKNGMKVSGKKSTLTKRMKKAKLMKGGAAQYLPGRASAGFTGAGAARGIGGYQDVGIPTANQVQSV